MTLTKGDDFPIRQTSEPIAYAGTDRNFYDRYFFNGYGAEGGDFFALAFGVYPHLNIADAAFCIIGDGVQTALHANDRRLASVGTTGLSAGQSSTFSYVTNAENQTTGQTQASEVTIAYPPGSLLQTASYNALNQLTNLTGQAQTFDADGNLTSDGTRNYSWDAENRLIAIAYPGQSSKATTFAYDGLGRRVLWSSTPAGGGAVITSYLWCGQALCQARNNADAVIRGYYSEGEFVPGSPSASYYYAPDRVGSMRRAFSASAAPAYDYDTYGNPLQATAQVTDYGYAGMIANPDSGLYLTTHRPYDPVTGRFLLRDPIGEAGDPEGNLYVYVGDDPVNLSDPAGLYTPSQLANIVYNETSSLSGAAIDSARTVLAYTLQNRYNAGDLSGVANDYLSPRENQAIENGVSSALSAYQSSVAAAARAINCPSQDPTRGGRGIHRQRREMEIQIIQIS